MNGAWAAPTFGAQFVRIAGAVSSRSGRSSGEWVGTRSTRSRLSFAAGAPGALPGFRSTTTEPPAPETAAAVRGSRRETFAWYLDYRFVYLFVRTFFRTLEDRTAPAMLYAWARAGLRREPRYADLEVRRFLRDSKA